MVVVAGGNKDGIDGVAVLATPDAPIAPVVEDRGVSAKLKAENGVPVAGARDLLAWVLTSKRLFCLALKF